MSRFKLFRKAVCAALCLMGAFVVTLANAGPVAGQGTWGTTLQARDINGDGVVDAYYDTALGITWLGNWNVNGRIDWPAAMSWATGLNEYGVTGWRLPNITDMGCNWSFSGTDCGFNVDTSGSELAHMYSVTLGNKAEYDTAGNDNQPGFGLTNTGPFINMQPDLYWSRSAYATTPNHAWVFSAYGGNQGYLDWTGHSVYAVAVHDGDVAAVIPEPATLAPLTLGLAGVGFSRRQRALA